MSSVPGFIVRLSTALTWVLVVVASSGAAPAAGETILVRAGAIGANDGSSWDDAFGDLQDALAVAQPSDEIWLAAGVYKPDRGTGDRYATFELVSGVGVYGGFAGWETDRDQRDPAANEAILSGDLNGDDGSLDCGKDSNCCVDHIGYGCENQACQEKVCEVFPDCCENAPGPYQSGTYWSCGRWAEILCCELTARSCENSLHVVTALEPDSSTILDGVTITGGRADGGPELDNDHVAGGGVLVRGGKPVFANCIFRANTSFVSGAGLVLDGSDATISRCVFADNLSFGVAGVSSRDGSPTLTDCVFTANNGGGMFSDVGSDSSGPRLENCLFQENFSGAAFAHDDDAMLSECTFVRNASTAVFTRHGQLTLSGCTFLNNARTSMASSFGSVRATNCRFLGNKGAAVNLSFSNGGFTNCLFSGNTGSTTILVGFSGFRATNCTFVGNSSGASSIRLSNGGARLDNCILWGNTSRQLSGERAQIGGDPDNIWINHTLVEGWTGTLGGVGNFDADPLFLDADGFDNIPGTRDDGLQLQAGSPAVNAGDKSDLPDDVLDLDGDGDTEELIPFDLAGLPRIQNKAVDLGAYEGGNQMIVTDTDELSVPEGGVASFGVSLLVVPEELEPGGVVTVYATIHHGDSDISVQPGQSLNFHAANYTIPQTVTIAAAPDTDFVNGVAAIRLSAAGIAPARVNVREVDTDPVQSIVFVDRKASGDNIGLSWPDAFNDLADALAVAEDRPGILEIWVTEGRYTPDAGTGDREATFELVNGTDIYGGFAGWETQRDQRDGRNNLTILSGDLAGDDEGNPSGTQENSRHVVTTADVDPSTVLDGFTISGGNSTRVAHGAGLLISSGSPTIANCLFTDNVAVDGGAVWMHDTSSSVFRNCIFRGNVAHELAGALHGSPTLINCLLTGNTAAFGNVGAVLGFSPTLINCTVVQNVALNGDHGGVSGKGLTGRVDVRNSILWGNRGVEEVVEVTQLAGNNVEIDYSAVGGWSGRFGGVGNTGDSPLFVDPIGPDGIEGTGDEDFRLAADSPLINRGDPGYDPTISETDLSGEPRITGCRIDLGAFESDVFQATGDFDGDELRTLSDYAGFQNCFQAEVTNPDWLEACLCVFDSDGNASLDLIDFAAFHALLTGP